MTVGRITNLMTSNSVISNIENSEQQLTTTEEELSSGQAINEPSDNPVGAGLAVTLNGQLSQFTAYTDNTNVAQSWNSAASTGMTSLQQDLSRIQELVTEAGNGTENQTDLNDIAQEVSQLTSAVQSTLNTQYNGQAVFTNSSGATGSLLQGNQTVSLTISPGTSVNVTADLSGLINGTGTGATATTGLMDTLNQIQSDLTGTSVGGMTPSSGNLNGSDLTNLQANLSSLDSTQVTVGTIANQITLANTTLTSLTTSTTSELSNDTQVNMATAETDYNNEEAAFEAALKAGADIVQESLMDFLNT